MAITKTILTGFWYLTKDMLLDIFKKKEKKAGCSDGLKENVFWICFPTFWAFQSFDQGAVFIQNKIFQRLPERIFNI